MKYRDLLYPFRIFKHVLYLPKIVYKQNQTYRELEKVKSEMENVISNIKNDNMKIADLDKTTHTMIERLVDLKYVMSKNIDRREPTTEHANVPINRTVSDNHSLDHFYKLFEDRFRGTEADIKQRISKYRPFFEALPEKLVALPVIDLGCGRGEFLSFANDIGLKAIGIDMNHDMVKRAKKNGLMAYETDVMSYISAQKTNSLAAITGFHIVEHIPFDILIELFEECYRVLAPGGFVLFETPNPKNLNVGANSFYTDPSHIRPIPQELLSFALESVGFKTEIIEKNPAKEKIVNDNKDLAEILVAIYGAQDYAVFGKKT